MTGDAALPESAFDSQGNWRSAVKDNGTIRDDIP